MAASSSHQASEVEASEVEASEVEASAVEASAVEASAVEAVDSALPTASSGPGPPAKTIVTVANGHWSERPAPTSTNPQMDAMGIGMTVSNGPARWTREVGPNVGPSSALAAFRSS